MSEHDYSAAAENNAQTDMLVCPLCGRANNCRAQAISPCNSESCWCFDATIPAQLLDKIPESQRNRACICEDCIRRFPQELT